MPNLHQTIFQAILLSQTNINVKDVIGYKFGFHCEKMDVWRGKCRPIGESWQPSIQYFLYQVRCTDACRAENYVLSSNFTCPNVHICMWYFKPGFIPIINYKCLQYGLLSVTYQSTRLTLIMMTCTAWIIHVILRHSLHFHCIYKSAITTLQISLIVAPFSNKILKYIKLSELNKVQSLTHPCCLL